MNHDFNFQKILCRMNTFEDLSSALNAKVKPWFICGFPDLAIKLWLIYMMEIIFLQEKSDGELL